MVDITPFRAIRYNESKVGDLSQVIAPPYDVISPELQGELYGRSEHNIVRIDLNRAEPSDSALSRYERAARSLQQWLVSGVLHRDSEPSIYILSQSFVGPDGIERTRTGFFGRARLVRFDEGEILPHERTLKGPKQDRLELFRSTKTNLSPIFGAYHDVDGSVGQQLERARQTQPTSSAQMDGVRNELWAISDPAALAALTEAFRAKKLYIADGHHRYETGLAYRDERRAESGATDPSAGYEHILMFAAAVEDPGMVIFPTHRLVHHLADFDEAKLRSDLASYFELRSVSDDPDAGQAALREAGDQTNAFVLVTKAGRKLLVARPDAPWDGVPALPTHAALRRLDVSVLHGLVLEHLLGITREAQAQQTHLRYSKSWTEAWSAPSQMPDVQAAFVMNPTRIDEVIAVADGGEVMPQKSTYFYPKLPSGLVLYPLD